MSYHARRQIRDAAVTALTGLASTGSNVYGTRLYPRDVEPCLAVFALQETTDFDLGVESAAGTTRQHRVLDLMVVATVKVADSFDDDVDQVCLEVEKALTTASALLALVKELQLARTEIEFSTESEKPVGRARLMFRVEYRVDETAPETIIQ